MADVDQRIAEAAAGAEDVSIPCHQSHSSMPAGPSTLRCLMVSRGEGRGQILLSALLPVCVGALGGSHLSFPSQGMKIEPSQDVGTDVSWIAFIKCFEKDKGFVTAKCYCIREAQL